MNQVLHNVETAAQTAHTMGIKLIAFHTQELTEEERVERSVHENQRRSTEIGPVLEEILQEHWRHWGLND